MGELKSPGATQECFLASRPACTSTGRTIDSDTATVLQHPLSNRKALADAVLRRWRSLADTAYGGIPGNPLELT